MSSNNKWIQNVVTGYESTMNSKVVMTFNQVNNLWKWVLDSPISSAVVGDYTKWCSSLMFYPINFTYNDTEHKLSVGGVQADDIHCMGLLNSYDHFGYTLGEFYYETATSFLSYEPYTKVQIYLPYYGFIEVKISDIQGKYIQFRLYVDYNSGSAQYIVGVNSQSVNSPNAPYVLGTDDTNTRIIGTYNFQLGYNIPITSTGWAETFRNVALTVLKTGATIAGSAISSEFGLSGGTSVSKTVWKSRNPSTGRLITTASKERITETNRENFESSKRISTALDSVPSVLSAFNSTPTMDKSNNSIINSANCNSIVIITRITNTTIDRNDTYYKHLYGLPLGVTGLIGHYTGYTECSAIHFEGEAFNMATQTELLMIEEAFNDGVIL